MAWAKSVSRQAASLREKKNLPLLADGKGNLQWTHRRKLATGGAGQFEQERNHGEKTIRCKKDVALVAFCQEKRTRENKAALWRRRHLPLLQSKISPRPAGGIRRKS
jgi:hypothetical protein